MSLNPNDDKNEKEDICEIKNELKLISSKINYIQNHHRMLMHSLDDLKKFNPKDFLPQFFPWIITMGVMVIGACVLQFLPKSFLQIFSFVSSWFCTITILFCGLYSSFLARQKSKKVGILISVSYSAIFTCYLGYVLFNYGGYHPNISAIGFNISTIGQSVAILFSTFLITKYLTR